jgi:hypothetical protein
MTGVPRDLDDTELAVLYSSAPANQPLTDSADSAIGAISQTRRRPATLTHCDSYRPPGMLLSAFRSRELCALGF